MIDRYEEPATEEHILDDPKWREITEQAKRTISVWDYSSDFNKSIAVVK